MAPDERQSRPSSSVPPGTEQAGASHRSLLTTHHCGYVLAIKHARKLEAIDGLVRQASSVSEAVAQRREAQDPAAVRENHLAIELAAGMKHLDIRHLGHVFQAH